MMLYVKHNGYNVFRGYSVARTKLPCASLKMLPCRRLAQLCHAMGDVFVSNIVLRRMVLTTATAEQCTSPPASRQSSVGR